MARLAMPELLIEACDGDAALLAWVGTLRESWQRYIAQMVMAPKSDEAKQRRAADWAERLLLTMEAEQDLPPALARRLQVPGAQTGWQKMSVNRRRDYLLTIFGAKGLAARENQIVRWVDACKAKGKH